jgi:MinD-like ATPase involved in chromosome partitioning or flagellar assembly
MVYVCGSEGFKRRVAGSFDAAASVEEAACLVVEIPASLNAMVEKRRAGIPVLAVPTGMFSLSDLRRLREKEGILIREELLEQEVRKILAKTGLPEMRAGINEASAIELLSEKVRDKAIRSIISVREDFIPEPSGGIVVSSASSVPDVGKTLLATNLSAFSVQNGIKTVVVDIDTVGDTAQALGLEWQGSFATASTWRNFNLGDPGSLLRHKSGLYVIPRGRGEDDLAPEDMQDLLLNLKRHFSLVVVDHGNNPFLDCSKAALAMSDRIFVLANQTQKTLDKGVRLFEENRRLGRDKFILVINMVTPMGYYKPSEIARELKFASHEEIPMDPKSVNAAIRSKKTVVQLRDSQAGNAIKEIAGKYVLGGGYSFEKQAVGFWGRLGIFKRR